MFLTIFVSATSFCMQPAKQVKYFFMFLLSGSKGIYLLRRCGTQP